MESASNFFPTDPSRFYEVVLNLEVNPKTQECREEKETLRL